MVFLKLLKSLCQHSGSNQTIQNKMFCHDFVDQILGVFLKNDSQVRTESLKCLKDLFQNQQTKKVVEFFQIDAEIYLVSKENEFRDYEGNSFISLLLSSQDQFVDSEELIANIDLLWVLLYMARDASKKRNTRISRYEEEETDSALPIKDWILHDRNFKSLLKLENHPNSRVSELTVNLIEEFFTEEEISNTE